MKFMEYYEIKLTKLTRDIFHFICASLS